MFVHSEIHMLVAKLTDPIMVKNFLLFLLVTSLFACAKDDVKCIGDCAKITISGQVVDTPNLTGIANIPIKIFLRSGGPGMGTTTKDIDVITSDKQGNFKTTINIDTSLFPRYKLYIESNAGENYISPFEGDEYVYYRHFQKDILSVKFVLFDKAVLQIQLRNTQNETFNDFSLSYTFTTTLLGTFEHRGLPPLKDTTLFRETAANIYTRIFWSKTYAPGQMTYFSDSIICSKDGNNIYVLKY